MNTRVGLGFDVHAFSDDPDRVLVLAGVEFPGEAGLVGHSDADVVAHACIDALLGAAGLDDIGTHFPDTDPKYKNADSLVLLAEAVAMVAAAGCEIGNLDCVIITEQPKINPRRADMQQRLAQVVGAPVNIKATRAEGLGAIGRVEGMACLATAIVQTAEGD